MAASTAAALKGVLLVSICAMLLHSSMGQQPAPAPSAAPMPPSDCPRYCSSQCTPICQDSSDAAARRCDSIRPELAYNGCFAGCSSNCTGNSYARGTCVIGSCSASTCGCPCARRCCESCTGSAYGPYSMCMAAQPKVYSYCMMGCTASCNSRCVNGSVP
ncbi:hypothetical protein PAHAL_3G411400 [Panicum hallii]|uniref:Uncharacterized protein n=1 Tax=Panicum hallii TaxID=206008 RepID=A0A2S3HDN0_9POAL|nr:hypothetical protein PAHAL_3G411400 [Panicum hallii]